MNTQGKLSRPAAPPAQDLRPECTWQLQERMRPKCWEQSEQVSVGQGLSGAGPGVKGNQALFELLLIWVRPQGRKAKGSFAPESD